MQNRKLVVIGGDAAGMSAASKVRREHPGREIVVFERGPHTSYAACGMPYLIAGMVDSPDRLIARRPEVFREKQQIDVRIRHEVVEIDLAGKRLRVTDLDRGEGFWEAWDDLLIATGASPVVPDVPNVQSDGVFSLSTLQSGIEVLEDIEQHPPRTAVIAGGGYIGIEMAEALLERGIDVSLIDMAPQVMTTMDPDMTEGIVEAMRDAGVHVFLNEKLERIDTDGDGRASSVSTDKRRLDADIVIVGLGIRPNSDLARDAGIELGESGAIRVNLRMQTSAPGVWAAGDCAESFHRVKEQPAFVALGTIANRHGLVAGTNLSGGDQEFPGVLGTAITRFRELEIARTGLSEKEAGDLGIAYRTKTIDARTRAHYFPGAAKVRVKLVVEDNTGRLLGGQIVGANGAGKRIDTLAGAISARMTAEQLVYLDLAYAPPFSPVWDPVQTAARTLA
ncbi:Pyridine nucleotide-disulfide oxidoreductase; NADH dehydrogenase [Thioalkalivibrio nitratireducens DSM 14787]|uniref:Pyridine nucleotide-disulfide oxidoreductase NADH dehydrogenase n=1 Tax=Thioalkalivibrio nitratireducens (strain DSM 14787 / UNIQEM 213 / ALEN2) TaxID=1255043 RepID=L0DV30_THIND|nr:FAD-dependent oxidoreductase [Thioalkalivibrio nitratireducens]AGA32850.1 Pyridine nucleotide-disulfide oxidoreductase; NADH dehydrogenase [Thioalkalivibrio nitratireducens DSM 14787]